MATGTIDLERDSGVWVVTLHGEHDLSTASQLRNALARSFSGGSAVIVDLSQAEFIDSTIVHVLVRVQRERYPVALVAPPGGVPRRLLDLVRLPEAISTFHTRAETLEHLGANQRQVVPTTKR
jgi:anti-anti-sigma factor